MNKEALRLDRWQKDVAPSDNLRRWFGHDPNKWDEFCQRYYDELNSKPDTWQPLLTAARQGKVTLLFSAKDLKYNNAVALKIYLEKQLT